METIFGVRVIDVRGVNCYYYCLTDHIENTHFRGLNMTVLFKFPCVRGLKVGGGDKTSRNVLFFQQHAWTDSCAVRMCLPKSMCILYGGSLHHCKSPGMGSWLLDDVHLGDHSPLSLSKIIVFFLCVLIHSVCGGG